ncbi:hypothetical protein B842_05070 [Corynebacterium humireducens NBRC 106098 = DSM 45392]|uniref:ABC transporter substrate-binding protein n=1 Tax=Corynebacterium humireducens NBRC 106098 = DSM 45392 TaxID=1223515 RepID=A0A0B5D1X8_9CORY|nr:hypothetical protein B842_05070 [Corynebacterium humireducens NBRC 106098 = DSM 45392]
MWSATLAAVTLLAGLAGCSTAEPGRSPDPDHERPVRILVSGHSPEQLILGQIYLQVLNEEGREADLISESTPQPLNRLARLREKEVDLVIGCTGNLLHRLDPVRAHELSAEIAAGKVEDPADQTHREFVGALPGSLTTTDPSSAQGCAEDVHLRQVPDLPESIVPVFSRDLFDREETAALAAVTRVLTTEEIASLIEELEKESSVSTVVAEWLGY